MTSTAPRRSRPRRPVLVPAMVLLAGAGLGATAAMGGLEAAPTHGPALCAAGEEIDQHMFRTKIENAVVHAVELDGDEPSAAGHVVLDLNLKIYNDAKASVPLTYLENSLRVTSPDGRVLMAPAGEAGSGDAWVRDTTVPGDGGASGLLPPRRTSTVVIRLRDRSPAQWQDARADAARYPDAVAVDAGRYEHHEDFLTGRDRAEPVRDDDGRPEVVAHVTVPVRKAV